MAAGEMTCSYIVRGKVQRVMFRQTLIRAMIKRNLEGGATNNHDDKNAVEFTVKGLESEIKDLCNAVLTTNPLNSWGANATSLTKIEGSNDWKRHKVTTENVDSFNWSKDVEFYL